MGAIEVDGVAARGEPFWELVGIVGTTGMSGLPGGVDRPEHRGIASYLNHQAIVGTRRGHVGGIIAGIADGSAGPSHGLASPVQKLSQITQVRKTVGQDDRVNPAPGPTGHVWSQSGAEIA